MSLIFLIGPPAVGKMTVGQELARLLGYKLFHNHIAIDMVAPYFSYGTSEGRRLVQTVRDAFFDAFAANTGAGYVFTYVWAFGAPGEQEYVEGIANRFEARGHPVHWVELTADFETRLHRNRTENRLAHKPTKRDLEWSEKNMREMQGKHRLNSLPGEMRYETYLRIDNTSLPPDEVAEQICAHFDLRSANGKSFMKQCIRLQPIKYEFPSDIVALQSDAVEEGYRFVDRLIDEGETRFVQFAKPDEALLIARYASENAGIGGVTTDPFIPSALRMRRFYVRPRFRRHGIAKKLAMALIQDALTTVRALYVNDGTSSTPSFWENMGIP